MNLYEKESSFFHDFDHTYLFGRLRYLLEGTDPGI